jgi:hypothetical protein
MNNYRFSGHDTFHCRQQWLTKGVKFIEYQGNNFSSDLEKSILELGVGKNMVQSIQHWLKSFGLIDENHNLTEIAKLLFIQNNGFDPYLEDEGTLWLLHYKLCNTKYASIYDLIFRDYFLEKVKLEFTENEILKYIKDKLDRSKEREVSENTLISDFKAFIRTYSSPKKTLKTIEDDFNSPLLELNLISQFDHIYRINKEVRESIPLPIFGYCLIDFFGDRDIVNFYEIRNVIGGYFCLSYEGLDQLLESLTENYPDFIDKSDGGIRQISIKNNKSELQNSLLLSYYGI